MQAKDLRAIMNANVTEAKKLNDTVINFATLATGINGMNVKKKITPRQLLPLPWDSKHGSNNQESHNSAKRNKRQGLRN